MKKKSIIYLLVVFAILISNSCGKEFLETPKLGEPDITNFYQTEADAFMAINAAYGSLQMYTYVTTLFGMGDICSDDAEKGSESGDFVDFQLLKEFRGNGSNLIVIWKWRPLFRCIFRANLVLQKIPDIEMDEETKNRLLAEALFLRAFCYFDAVRTWGGVPLMSEPLVDNFEIPRSSAAEVYAQIEEDLIAAIPDLYTKSELAAIGELGRATVGAAQTLLGKAYLYQEKWSDAEEMLLNVINSTEYSLPADFTSIFRLEGENGPGSIWEINFMEEGDPENATANDGNFAWVFQMNRSNARGWGFNQPTQDLVDEFEAGDPRLEATIIYDGEVIDGEVQDHHSLGDNTGYHSRKIFLSVNEDPEYWRLSPVNERIFRLADVYLMYAEAACENGNLDAAKTYLNLVRERARGGDNTVLPDFPGYNDPDGNAYTDDQDGLRNAIYHERRVELAMEHHRFWDVVRTGRGPDLLPDFTAGINEIFPIPQSEIDITNGVVTQNPGY